MGAAALVVVELAVPLGLGEDGLADLLAHALFVETLEGDLVGGVEAGLEPAVRRQADAVALAAEALAQRADQADPALRARQPVQPGDVITTVSAPASAWRRLSLPG